MWVLGTDQAINHFGSRGRLGLPSKTDSNKHHLSGLLASNTHLCAVIILAKLLKSAWKNTIAMGKQSKMPKNSWYNFLSRCIYPLLTAGTAIFIRMNWSLLKPSDSPTSTFSRLTQERNRFPVHIFRGEKTNLNFKSCWILVLDMTTKALNCQNVYWWRIFQV